MLEGSKMYEVPVSTIALLLPPILIDVELLKPRDTESQLIFHHYGVTELEVACQLRGPSANYFKSYPPSVILS